MVLKNNTQKQTNLLSKKLNMSPKNLNVIKTRNLASKLSNNRIKNLFKKFEKNFGIKDDFAVAVSGGPDSLALTFLTKIYALKYNLNCKYFIVDHRLRNESTQEAKRVKKTLKNFGIKLEILTWKGKKPLSNIQSLARKKRYELLFLKCKHLKYIAIQVFNFFIKDPSNENTNFTRIKVRKIINSFKDNGLENDKLFLTLKNLKGSDKVIQFYTEQNKRQNSYLDKENKKLFLNKLFFSQPYEVIFRSFSDSLKYIGRKYFSARGKKIDYILKLIEKGTLKKETLAGCVIKKVNQTVIIAKEY